MTTKLLLAATVALGLGAGAAPAFAQSTTTSQPSSTASADNGAVSVQAQNFSQPQTMGTQSGDYAAAPSAQVGQSIWSVLPKAERWDDPNG